MQGLPRRVVPLALGAAACSPHQPRDVALAQVEPGAVPRVGPEEGIAVGVTLRSVRQPSGQPLAPHLLLRNLVVLADAAGREYGVPQGFPDAAVVQEDGAVLALHPFAFVMRAGEGRVVGLDTLGNLSGLPPRWHRRALPGPAFVIRPGRTTYVGRIGEAYDERAFRDAVDRDAACPARERFDTAVGPACIAIRPVAVFLPGRDLPLIRARWPQLPPE